MTGEVFGLVPKPGGEDSGLRARGVQIKTALSADVVGLQSIGRRSKTHKRLKERFLIRRNRTKRANFRCNHLFQAMYNTTENS